MGPLDPTMDMQQGTAPKETFYRKHKQNTQYYHLQTTIYAASPARMVWAALALKLVLAPHLLLPNPSMQRPPQSFILQKHIPSHKVT